MLKGIDVSSHNAWPFSRDTEALYKQSNFVIAKATQATTYVNLYCDNAIQRAINDGKLWGFYHYAGGLEPEAEAEFFVRNCVNYFGQGIPCLDWEQEQNAAFGSSDWCYRFVNRVHALTGVWCLIYTGVYQLPQVANCADKCGLWLAYWNSAPPASVSPWETWTVWQWTASPIDQNYFNGDAKAWAAIARGDASTPAHDGPSQNDLENAIETIAQAVIAGRYGTGEARKNALYNAIQGKVNEILC